MYFFYIFIGIIVVLPLAQYLMLVIKLYGIQLRPAKLKPCSSSVKLPRATQQQFALAQESMSALGFEYFDHIVYQDIIATSKPTVQLVMYHPKHGCYATISNPHNPDINRPYALKFQSFSQHLTIEAMDADAEGVLKAYEPLHAFNFEADHPQEAFDEFLAVREGLTSAEDNFLVFKDAQSYTQHMQNCYAQYLRSLYQKGVVLKNKNALQLRFSEAAKLAWLVFKDSKKAKSLTKEQANEAIHQYPFLPSVQAMAHRRVQKNQQSSQLNHWGKTLLFFASALVFSLLFGIAWSPFLVLILIPVLLFHELGHFLMMKLFGYRDLQILFLPIGAMVSGNKKNPSAIQKTLVSLAGPVPGLLLAFGLAVWAPDFIVSEYGLTLVFMLLIINYLNLLPFMPLDGGHVVNLLLFDRWPFLQFGLMLTSVLVFALGAWAWSDPILTFLAVIFGIGLKNNFQHAQYVSQARQRWGDKLKNRDNLAVIYQMMKHSPAPFNNKYQDATPINERLSHPSPSLRDSLLGMAMYLTALFAPLVVVQQVIGLDILKFVFGSTASSVQHDADDYQQWDPTYWQQQFNQTPTPSEQRDVIQQALLIYQESEDYYLLSEIYPQAIALYESNLWQDDPNYADLLHANLMYQASQDPEYDAQQELLKLAELLGKESIGYAKVLVDVLTWTNTPDSKKQLLGRLSQLEAHQQYETLLNALTHLYYLYEQDQQLGAYESLLNEYLPIFKSQAADLYPNLLHYHYQALFAQQKYQQLLELAEHDVQSITNDLEFAGSLQYELLAWVALLDHQYDLAQSYQQLRLQVEQKQQQALKDEMGFLGGLVISDQVSAMSLNQDPLFNLALAVQKNQPNTVANELTLYIQFIQGWRKQTFSEYLHQIKHLDDSESTQLHHIKHQFLFQAIRAEQPELLKPDRQ